MSTPIYCTWSHRADLPQALRYKCRDLDQFLRELIASADERIVLVAPYLSALGLSAIGEALAISAKRGAWIRLVTMDIMKETNPNSQALVALLNSDAGHTIRNRLRVLTTTGRSPLFIHAKLIIVDGRRGYLGSANLSESALNRNLEVGIAVDPMQAETLDSLVAYMESRGLIKDYTDEFISLVDA